MLSFIGRRSAIIVVIAGVVGVFLAGVEILLTAYIVKLLAFIGVGESGNGVLQSFFSVFDSSLEILIGFVIVTALRSVLHIAKGYCVVSANEIFVTRLRLLCISSTLNKHGPRYNSSRVYSLISDVFLKSALTFSGVANSIPMIAHAILLFAFLLSLSVYLSLIGVFFVFFAGLAVYIVQRKIESTVRPLSKINDNLYQSLKRILENLLLIRFCKLEMAENLHAVNFFRDYLYRVRKSSLLALFCENIPSFLGAVVIAVLFLMQLQEPGISAEVFIAFVYIFVRFVQSLSLVVSFLSTSVINLPYFIASRNYFKELPCEALLNIDSTLSKQGADFSEAEEVRACGDFSTDFSSAPSISVVNLDYGYDEHSSVFHEFSFSVEAGAQCVIVGPSGVGKSTLLNLLVGELHPRHGDVEIGGLDPEVFLERHSQHAAYAGPEPLLFEGSVRENLTYGARASISDDQIISTLESLGLHEWLEQFDCNLGLPLGEGGVGISSGQAQRLSIARALLRRPKLLILDEVTANLDSKAETQVLEILECLKVNTTVIVVTHSAQMKKNADQVIDLSSVK